MSASQSRSVQGVTATNIASTIVAPFAKVVHYFRREAEIAHAERHMEQMNDHLLKDIGVHRSQVHIAARMGRDEYGRRYL